MVNVSNIERDIAITRINYRYFYYFFSNDREFIIVICRKNVLIDAFVLNKIVNIIVKVTFSP
jgi:hypothetical protein